jgi:hypothetical protein
MLKSNGIARYVDGECLVLKSTFKFIYSLI